MFKFVGWRREYIDKNLANGLDMDYEKFKKKNKNNVYVCSIEWGPLKFMQKFEVI